MADKDRDSNAFDPVVRALRRLAGQPQPTAADRRQAEEALQQAIDQEASKERRLRPPRRSWSIGFAIAAVVVIVGLTVQLLRPTAASAALSEIASAAERVDPLVIPAQSFAYTRSETTLLAVQPSDAFGDVKVPAQGVAYLLPQTREAWIGADGTVQLRLITHPPTFFIPDTEAAYYTAGLDLTDRVGETVTTTVSGASSLLKSRTWPIDPNQLLQVLRSLFPSDRGLPEAVEILDLALDLLRETGAAPELRAALLRVLSTLDLELVERRSDGAVQFAVTYEAPLLTRDTFTLDPSGYLLEENTTLIEGDPNLSIPSGTVIWNALYEPTSIVESLSHPR